MFRKMIVWTRNLKVEYIIIKKEYLNNYPTLLLLCFKELVKVILFHPWVTYY